MAKPHFQHEFILQTTKGEARDFFGDLSKPNATKPVLKITVTANDSVDFKVTGSSGTIDFATNARARYLGSTDICFPDETIESDLIVGDIYGDDPNKRQLFLMWVRIDPRPTDPAKYLTLGFYIFKHDSRLSKCKGDLFGSGVGQDAGGGTGSGPH